LSKTEWKLDLLGKHTEKLDNAQAQTIVIILIHFCRSQPDETEFRLVRRRKRGRRPQLEIVAVRDGSISVQLAPSLESSRTHDCRYRDVTV
jgi:hypothetical protein